MGNSRWKGSHFLALLWTKNCKSRPHHLDERKWSLSLWNFQEAAISQTVVYRWTRWEEEGTQNDPPGAPKKATQDQAALITEMVEAIPFTKAAKNPRWNAVQCNLSNGEENDYVQDGIHHRTPAIRGRLTERFCQGRLQQYVESIEIDYRYRLL